MFLSFVRSKNGTLLQEGRFGKYKKGYCPDGPSSRYDMFLVRNGFSVNKKYGRPPLEYINVLSRFGDPSIASVDIIALGSSFFYFDLEMPTGDPQADKLRSTLFSNKNIIAIQLPPFTPSAVVPLSF